MDKPIKRRFNIVDVIIIVIIICAVFVGAKVFGKFSSDASKANQTVYFEFLGKEVRYEGANKVKVGDAVYNSTNSAYVGEVEKIDISPYYETVFNPVTGENDKVEIEGQCYVDIVVKSQGYVTDEGIFPEGQSLRVGQEFFLKGKGYAFEGYIVGVSE